MAAPKSGGFKMSLGALKAKPGLKASPAQKDNKKPKALLGDDEPDDSVKQQEITGWDVAEGGAVDAGGKKEKEQLRVIPVLPNRDWRAAARRKHLAKAPHQQAQNETVDEKQMEEPKMKFGLTVVQKDEIQEDGAAEAEAPEPMEVEQDNLTEQERLEKKALDALITGKSTDNDLVIPVQTEEEALRNDLDNAPEAPTLEAYEATPIEGFGAALLRGMGWKDGEAIGKNGPAAKPKEIKRRPALLGIGAKEEAAVGIELGEWGGGNGKGKGKKVAQSYNPVTLRNKHTGEMITEEELKAKLENQQLVQEEKPLKTKTKYEDNSEDERRRERRREKRDDRDRRRDRDDSDSYHDPERRRDKDRRREKDDHYHDSNNGRRDSERRREKRRDRSRSPDDAKEKRSHRDRYRSRSRDSKPKSSAADHRRNRSRSRSHDSDDRRKRRRERDYRHRDDDYNNEDDELRDRYERKNKKHRDDKYYK
ncbi:DNA primase large subunit Spp2 [Exserohilum turcicum]|uniref:Pre-mRNA-splicing factor n=1 Tax=Exserohilum turcicum (strain 28A) TaxID=671987 RepID=R0JX53_EXST2|nr:uncharacterized protein SETTUDRAFT_143918 [Exserohilum turcica Et28A]EOA80847.1 hypothetical protein SETTUDRAFT_143918 [Exserohilum turcica Et28A]